MWTSTGETLSVDILAQIPTSTVGIISVYVWREESPEENPLDYYVTLVVAPEQPQHVGPHGGLSVVQRLQVDPELASVLLQVTENPKLYAAFFSGMSHAIQPFSSRCTLGAFMELNLPVSECKRIKIDAIRSSTTCEGGFDFLYCPVTMKLSELTQCNVDSLDLQHLLAPMWQHRSKSLFRIYCRFYTQVTYALDQVAHEREITLGRRHNW
jgi:hypothetical protein